MENTVKQVKLVNKSPYKDPAWSEKHMDKIFNVIQQREGGFDCDMEPCGYPGRWGFLHDHEVEILRRCRMVKAQKYAVKDMATTESLLVIIKLLPSIFAEMIRDFVKNWTFICLFFIILIFAYILLWTSPLILILKILASWLLPSLVFLVFATPKIIKELKR